jgi:hypothetical protein
MFWTNDCARSSPANIRSRGKANADLRQQSFAAFAFYALYVTNARRHGNHTGR